MFKFRTTEGRVVNRFGLSIKADQNGIITTDNKEIADIMRAMKFEDLNEEVKEIKTVIKKRNAKV